MHEIELKESTDDDGDEDLAVNIGDIRPTNDGREISPLKEKRA
jgi:hypothetical protein